MADSLVLMTTENPSPGRFFDLDPARTLGVLDACDEVPPSLPGWKILGIAGRGGFGTVWRAERDSDGALAAIKIASADDPDTLERIEEEAGALRSLNHPHIVSLMESGPLDDHDDLEIAGQVPGGRTRARFRLRQPPAKSPRWLNVDLMAHEGSLKCVRLAH